MKNQQLEIPENQTDDENEFYVWAPIMRGVMVGFQFEDIKQLEIHQSNYMMAYTLFEALTLICMRHIDTGICKCAMIQPELRQFDDGGVSIGYSVVPEYGFEGDMINNFDLLQTYKQEKKLLEDTLSIFLDVIEEALPDGCEVEIDEDDSGVKMFLIDADSRDDLFRLLEAMYMGAILFSSEEINAMTPEPGQSKKDAQKELAAKWKKVATSEGKNFGRGATGRKLWEESLFENLPREPGIEGVDPRISGLRSHASTCRYSLTDIQQVLRWEGIHLLQKQESGNIFPGIQ